MYVLLMNLTYKVFFGSIGTTVWLSGCSLTEMRASGSMTGSFSF